MTLPRWDDEMRFELLRLKNELKAENFRILHHPIGLRAVAKVQEARAQTPQIPLPMTRSASLSQSQTKSHSSLSLSQSTANAPSKAPASANKRINQTSRFRPSARAEGALHLTALARVQLGITKRLVIHALDIVFVSMTIGLGLLLASWITDPTHLSKNPELLRQTPPLRFLMHSNVILLVALLYGFFSLYWLFFKLVTGSTLGESFLDNFRNLQNPRGGASAKDSGDS
jgi:hypothetical protein